MSNQSTKNDLYRVLRERLKAGDTVTPQSLANETGVSRATVYRFAKSLGYRDWSDCIAQLSSFYSKEAKKRAEQETVDYERLARLIVDNRDKIAVVQAIGDAEICREYLISRLAGIGIIATSYTPAIVELLEQRGEGGLAFIINESGIALQEICGNLIKHGFKLITICANPHSPVARLATYAVTIENNKSTLDAYRPNYFTAGALMVLEHAIEAARNNS